MLRIGGLALALAALLFVAGCSQKSVFEQQNDIAEEVAEKYGFPDVSIDNRDTERVELDEERNIKAQWVSVRIGEIRQPGDPRKTCYGEVIWRRNTTPDLQMEIGGTQVYLTNVNYDEVRQNPVFAECFKP